MANQDTAPAGMRRQEADKQGFKFFISSKCKRGHDGRRYVRGGECVECCIARALKKQKDDPQYARDRDKQYREGHPGQARKRQRRWLREPDNRAKSYSWTADWRERNPDYHRNYGRTYKANRLKTDLEFKLREYLRSRLRIAVKQNNRAGSAVRDLGCSIAEFKAHIEGLFKPGMTWDNWGVGSGCWNLDHIRELATIDMQDRAQFLQVAHYTNYQPLWSEENNAKRALPAGRRRTAAWEGAVP